MTCFHIPYFILSHVPFFFILSFIFFRSFQLEGKLGHLGLLGLETFGPWEDSTEDYLFWSNVDVPYKGVDPSLGSLLRLGHQPLLLLDILHTRQPLLPICQGGPRRSPEIQSTLVWSSCWGATGSARCSMQRGEQRRVVRARGNKGEVGVTRDQCRVW